MFEKDTLADLGNSASRGDLAAVDAYYLNTVQNSVHLLDNLMGPILGTAHDRFQAQIADRVSALNDKSTGIRAIFLGLLLCVLILFLLRILKLNLNLMTMVRRRTAELENIQAEQEHTIKERTEGLTAANARLRDEIRERETAELQILQINRLYATLSNVNQSIAWIHETDALMAEICRIAIEDGKFQSVWIGVLNPQTGKMDAYSSPGGQDGLSAQALDLAAVIQGGGPTGLALEQKATIILNDLSNGPGVDPWIDGARPHEYRSGVAVPLFVKEKLIGALTSGLRAFVWVKLRLPGVWQHRGQDLQPEVFLVA